MLGDVPPPCRAHTATLVDRRIVVFGGGEGPAYYNDVYVLDTISRRWTHKVFPQDLPLPPPRRAHTAVLYKGKVWVFGGGNGMEALNDLWTLDCTGPTERMRWEHMETRGRRPLPRGYHTANLVGNVMVVVGGSDGRECFSDIWCINLGTYPHLRRIYPPSSVTQIRCGGPNRSSKHLTVGCRTRRRKSGPICSSWAVTMGANIRPSYCCSTLVCCLPWSALFAC